MIFRIDDGAKIVASICDGKPMFLRTIPDSLQNTTSPNQPGAATTGSVWTRSAILLLGFSFVLLGALPGNGTERAESPLPTRETTKAPADSQAKPPSTNFEGSLDKVEVATVGGWAWDSSRPETPIQVEIYDGKILLSTITASEFREDLKKAGKGDGKHAFNYALATALRDGQSHTISVRFAGSPIELPGSPKTLFFPKP